MSICFNEAQKTFYLESKGVTYAFRIHPSGFLQHWYFGKQVGRDDLTHVAHYTIRGHAAHNPLMPRDASLDDLAQEFPLFGRSDFRESMLAFCADGVRVGDFLYDSHAITDTKPEIPGMPSLRGGQTLCITLKDALHELTVQLYYSVYEDVSVISRRAVVTNNGEKAIQLNRAYSFSLDLPDSKFQTITLDGAHLRERYISRNDLTQGIFTVDSKCGVSSARHNPFMALARRCTTEDQGEVYGFQLLYSGNFALKAEVGQDGGTRILGGIHDYDFSWELAPGDSFATPEAVLIYSNEGLGGMSRTFHDLYRQHMIAPRFVNKSRPIVLNNWEATYYDFDEEKLCALIEKVKDTGIDTFVLDDGWFGSRNGEMAGLGDWCINRNKLPNGLTPIIDCAHRNGLRFGLWFEPEMVNMDTDLYRAHPDWIIHVPGLEPCSGRFQYVLDLTRKEVRDYIVHSVSAILSKNVIDYVKWDMNRSVTENYSPALGANSMELHHRYVLGLYDILERITERFPHVLFEGCASGGCRFDPAMLRYFPQIWTSDNSDAYSRIHIQYGTSLCYPLSSQSCHVSVTPNHQTGRYSPFASRTAIAHLGATGYELDPNQLSEGCFRQIEDDTREYRKMEHLILTGDLYRLNSPFEENLFAEMIVAKDKSNAVITVMVPHYMANGYPVRIYPRGLEENANYMIEELDCRVLQGATIMNAGLPVNPPWGDYQTAVYHLKKEDKGGKV